MRLDFCVKSPIRYVRSNLIAKQATPPHHQLTGMAWKKYYLRKEIIRGFNCLLEPVQEYALGKRYIAEEVKTHLSQIEAYERKRDDKHTCKLLSKPPFALLVFDSWKYITSFGRSEPNMQGCTRLWTMETTLALKDGHGNTPKSKDGKYLNLQCFGESSWDVYRLYIIWRRLGCIKKMALTKVYLAWS